MPFGSPFPVATKRADNLSFASVNDPRTGPLGPVNTRSGVDTAPEVVSPDLDSPTHKFSDDGSTAMLKVRSTPLGVRVAEVTRNVSGLTTCTAPSSRVNACVVEPIFRTVAVAPSTN